jgi:hypothetical protein
MAVSGTDPFQRDSGPVDEYTMRVALGADASGPLGTTTDAPLADGVQASAAAASIVALLKTIVNNTDDIEVTLENNGTIEVAVDELENAIGRIAENIKITNPDAASASLNSLTRGTLQTLLNILNSQNGTVAQNLITNIDDAGGGVTYVGEAAAGSADAALVWRIKKIIVSGSSTTIRWAELAVPGTGDQLFTKQWTNRAAYTYS